MIERRKRWTFWWQKRSRDRVGPEDNPMLERWQLIKTPWFGVYVHFIYREDRDRHPHDHPWGFWSLVLRGAYVEEYYREPRMLMGKMGRQIRGHIRGHLHHFPLEAAHRIVDVDPGTIILVFVGRKRREWGFFRALNMWVPWREYQYVAPPAPQREEAVDVQLTHRASVVNLDAIRERQEQATQMAMLEVSEEALRKRLAAANVNCGYLWTTPFDYQLDDDQLHEHRCDVEGPHRTHRCSCGIVTSITQPV